MRGEEAKLLDQERATMERRVKHQIQVSLQAPLASAEARSLVSAALLFLASAVWMSQALLLTVLMKKLALWSA